PVASARPCKTPISHAIPTTPPPPSTNPTFDMPGSYVPPGYRNLTALHASEEGAELGFPVIGVDGAADEGGAEVGQVRQALDRRFVLRSHRLCVGVDGLHAEANEDQGAVQAANPGA